jgi:hypothetical protein
VAQPSGFIEHRGQRIFLIDIEALPADQVIALIDVVAREIRAEPAGSVRSLTHVKDAVVTTAMVERLRWLADGNRSHVKAAAIAGLSPAQRIVFTVVKTLTGRDFRLFATLAEAKDWLASVP